MTTVQHNSPSGKIDILIVGGGLVGGSLAVALASVGFNIVVADHIDQRSQLDAEFDGRASAIALTPQKMLTQIGMWQHIEDNTAAIKDIRVADGDSRLFLHYDHLDIGEEALGYMVENRFLRQAIFACIAQMPNITYAAPLKIKACRHHPGGVEAVAESGDTVTASLIVGADGRASQIREDAGISLIQWSYHQTG